MKATRHAIGCLLAGFMLAGAPAPALAADITQGLGFDLTDVTPAGTGVTASLHFNQFDPSLGTLQQVFLGHLSGFGVWITYDASSGQTIEYEATTDTKLVLVPVPTVLHSRLVGAPGNTFCAEPPGTDCPGTTAGFPWIEPDFWFDILLPVDPLFSLFLGTGTVQIDAVLDGGGHASLLPDHDPVLADVMAIWKGAVQVSYTFEPAQGVPAPPSLVVLLTGLLVPLALRARRRRDP